MLKPKSNDDQIIIIQSNICYVLDWNSFHFKYQNNSSSAFYINYSYCIKTDNKAIADTHRKQKFSISVTMHN